MHGMPMVAILDMRAKDRRMRICHHIRQFTSGEELLRPYESICILFDTGSCFRALDRRPYYLHSVRPESYPTNRRYNKDHFSYQHYHQSYQQNRCYASGLVSVQPAMLQSTLSVATYTAFCTAVGYYELYLHPPEPSYLPNHSYYLPHSSAVFASCHPRSGL